MPIKNTAARYGAVAQGLHWLHVIGLIAVFTLGLVMVDMALSPTTLRMYAWHKWLGVCVFALVWLRLAWRLFDPPPPAPASTPVWQRRLAGLAHALLYLLLILVPLSGWLMSSAKGFPTVLFGVLPLPDVVGRDADLASGLEMAHFMLNKSLLLLIALHVLAAIKHHVVDCDGVLLRMLPALRRPGSPR